MWFSWVRPLAIFDVIKDLKIDQKETLDSLIEDCFDSIQKASYNDMKDSLENFFFKKDSKKMEDTKLMILRELLLFIDKKSENEKEDLLIFDKNEIP